MDIKINSSLDENGKIKAWPAKYAKQRAVLEYMSEKFNAGCTYTEKEVNEIITEWHTFGDLFLLRRGMIDEGLLRRTPNGAEYWKMSVDKYNKLVRDKTPDIIKSSGGLPKTETLDGESYFSALNQKLKEEVAEYFEDYRVEELADIVEVALALASYKGTFREAFERIRLDKLEERGGFEDRIFLVEVERK